jgi:twinkle protein
MIQGDQGVKNKVGKIREEHAKLLRERGLDIGLVELHGVESCDPTNKREKQFHIKIPYYENGVLLNWKYRTLEGPKLFSQTKGAKKTFYNVDVLFDPAMENEPVVIVEGEPDCWTVEMADYPRCVSVPDGAPNAPVGENSPKYDFLTPEVLERIRKAPKIIIATDGDANGQVSRGDLARIGKEPAKTWFGKYPTPNNSSRRIKDLNDIVQVASSVEKGLVYVQKVLDESRPMDLSGLYTAKTLPKAKEHSPINVNLPGGLGRHIKPRLGDFWVITGVPSHGKTQFTIDVVSQVCDEQNWTACLCSLENDPRTDLRRALLSWKARARLMDVQDAQELARLERWREERFVYILPSIEDFIDWDWLHQRMKLAVDRHKARVMVIDPWNELDIRPEYGERETDVIGDAIKNLRRFAKRYEVLMIVVAHPAKLLGKHNQVVKPNLYTISGSAHWHNKCDIGIVVWRDFDAGTTEIDVQKVKYQGIIGTPGKVTLTFAKDQQRFVALDEPDPHPTTDDDPLLSVS